ncbi:branched-chain amino acid ABC transporter permease [Pigmentiphaga daeguensis]|uniref:Branched-chain amino acid ABC transporter permease n=2 Tax=Pigmentiphaga daeguensis TaxID=414049 RepID=A0ABP3MJU8_9BURK
MIYFIEQTMNGMGYGLMLFLIAAGLTLVFGIMDTLNLAHGSMYMVGGYVAATVHTHSGSFLAAVLAGIVATLLFACLLEIVLFKKLYGKDHLTHVIATFGVILIADDTVRAIWGVAPLMAPTPAALAAPIELIDGLPYPTYRLVLLLAGLAVAAGLYVLVNHTRVGMLVRAGASNRRMAEFMGINVSRVFTWIFLLGAALAALAGALMGPIAAVEVGMGESIMIPAMVVIVIGGVGSIRGVFIASLMVGMVETYGKAYLPTALKAMLPAAVATDLGATLTSIAIYALMASVLVFKPAGLFPARG